MIHKTKPEDARLDAWVKLPSGIEVSRLPLLDGQHAGLFARLTYDDALVAAEHLGGRLVSEETLRELSDLADDGKALQLMPYLGTPVAETSVEHSRRHDENVFAQLRDRAWDTKMPVVGAGKHWIAGAPQGRSKLMGWDKDGPGPGEALWQPPAIAHNRQHHDDGTTTMIERGQRGHGPRVDDAPSSGAKTVTGLDISSHQPASRFDYGRIAEDHAFIIARACYGVKPDSQFKLHVQGARDAGMVVGPYVFFRQQQPWQQQFDVYAKLIEEAAVGGVGHLLPVVDLEANPRYDGKMQPAAHNTGGRKLVEALAERYGRCMVYLSPGHMVELGQPSWIREHTIWVAHIKVSEPNWPWGPWALWQKSWEHKNQGFASASLPLDLNECRGALPLLGGR